MKISIDGGGLCTDPNKRFGNYIFTENIIKALFLYDRKNFYDIYSFCRLPSDLKIPFKWKYKLLLPSRLWMKIRVSLEEIIHKKDIFLGLNQAVPLFSYAKIIAFSHGLSYYYFPHLYRESYIRLTMQLTPMIKNSDYIIVSSQKVKEEMKEVYPNYKNVLVIPYGIPFDMQAEASHPTGVWKLKKYFLFVGMNHPIKNINFLRKAFKKFQNDKKYKNYKFICVSSGLTREKIKELYQKATGYLTASLYESFNLPVLEALSQNCPVIGLKSAIIPELFPYVQIANDMDEFVNNMRYVVDKKFKPINLDELREKFSWRKYVEKLIELY